MSACFTCPGFTSHWPPAERSHEVAHLTGLGWEREECGREIVNICTPSSQPTIHCQCSPLQLSEEQTLQTDCFHDWHLSAAIISVHDNTSGFSSSSSGFSPLQSSVLLATADSFPYLVLTENWISYFSSLNRKIESLKHVEQLGGVKMQLFLSCLFNNGCCWMELNKNDAKYLCLLQEEIRKCVIMHAKISFRFNWQQTDLIWSAAESDSSYQLLIAEVVNKYLMMLMLVLIVSYQCSDLSHSSVNTAYLSLLTGRSYTWKTIWV